ncbi:lysophospholipid acyltransferase family protein [Gilvimarinus sp. F26214L]|uniref:lysophospholipid acyltransferase family protein n=1 Tax=Gilvimarinus sp. DZF01 TaxID=3461371 RepID=UPI00404663D9
MTSGSGSATEDDHAKRVWANMSTGLNRAWRVVATGLAFTLFGVGGAMLPLVAVPLIYLVPGDKLARERRAKAAIHYTMRGFVEIMRGLGILTYSVENPADFNRPGQLILANHPSLIDVVFLIAFIKRADCVVKSALIRNPFTRGPIGLAGYIANDDPEKVIEATVSSLARGNSLIIFPEGTRTTPGEPLRLQRGAANVALRAGVQITPVVIRCVPTTLTKNNPWYRVPSRRFHFSMQMQRGIDVAQFQEADNPSRAARRLTRYLQNYFTQKLADG